MTSKYMVKVGAFAYRTRMSRKSAYDLRRQLKGCVIGIKVEKMPEVIG